jgi:hypothetical protein
MDLRLDGWFPHGRCPHGRKRPCYCCEADFSRLVRFSGACNCSLTVYRQAGVIKRLAMFDQVNVGGGEKDFMV